MINVWNEKQNTEASEVRAYKILQNPAHDTQSISILYKIYYNIKYIKVDFQCNSIWCVRMSCETKMQTATKVFK